FDPTSRRDSRNCDAFEPVRCFTGYRIRRAARLLRLASSGHNPGDCGRALSARLHRFAKLNVGSLVIANPEILVADVKVSEADMVLGIDFLLQRRLWLSYGSRRIFLSSR